MLLQGTTFSASHLPDKLDFAGEHTMLQRTLLQAGHNKLFENGLFSWYTVKKRERQGPVMQELLHGAGIVCIYYVIAASVMLTLRWLIKIPNELFRKILHYILLISYIPFAFAFDTWWPSVLAPDGRSGWTL